MEDLQQILNIKRLSLKQVVDGISLSEFNCIAEIFTEALMNGSTIFWCGNGGSASESSHMATELLGRFKNNRKPYPSISLNADTTLITCIANDFGYDEIYARQLEGLSKPGDLVIVLSTSGQSRNIIRVLEQAESSGVISIGLLGKGGGPSAELSSYSIVIHSEETARIQEAHLLIGHTLCEYAEIKLGHM